MFQFCMLCSDAHLGPCQTSKMELFAKIVNFSLLPFTILAKCFIIGVWWAPKYPFVAMNLGSSHKVM